jgi:hypothetical protein
VNDPNDGSNEPGIGLWNPRALGVSPDDGTTPMRMIDYLESRMRRAIDVYGARYFKLDFLVWVDCAGVEPVDVYQYRDEFMTMLDRILTDHPGLTIQIDDTNDYRGFPFETTVRGPSWFLNGGSSYGNGPPSQRILHTAWNLAPYIPGSAIGARALSGANDRAYLDTAMAAAMLSHMTFSFPADERLTSSERDRVRAWTDFYRQNRGTLAGFTFPLLDDPASSNWTAFQPWDSDARSGWLIAFRQADVRATVAVPLRGLDGVDADATFSVHRFDPAGGTFTAQTLTAGELRDGISVGSAQNGYVIFRIAPEP